MGSRPENELVARCLGGDAEAWDLLFDQHYAATGRFVFQLGYDFTREDVEEIVQESFLSVVKNLRSFQGNSALQTWIFRIAANKARDYRQHQHAAKRGGGQTTVPLHAEDSEDIFTVDPPSTAPGPDLALLNAEKSLVVGRALEQLGGPCQEIIELRYFADLSYEEIAASLDMNPKTVSSRLSKCLDKLEVITRKLLLRENIPTSSVQPGA
jgi:RNA polymerase sigma-70 factor (ECF subfamily)